MPGGYFTDGTVTLELGAMVEGLPGAGREFIALGRPDVGARLLSAGGGLGSMSIAGRRLRANAGDAELYAHGMLAALAASSPGELGLEDALHRRVVLGGILCTGAEAEVTHRRLVTVRTDWRVPEQPPAVTTTTTTAGDWAALPAPPALYEDTSSALDYAAGGVSLGVGGSMRIEMRREADLRPIPRCRGAREAGAPANAVLRLIVTAYLPAGGPHPANDLRDRVLAVGTDAVDLTANGNTYSGVILAGVRPDRPRTGPPAAEWEFVQQVTA